MEAEYVLLGMLCTRDMVGNGFLTLTNMCLKCVCVCVYVCMYVYVCTCRLALMALCVCLCLCIKFDLSCLI